jgi:hypothetical protein
MRGNQICPIELVEILVNQNDKEVQAPNSIEEISIRGKAISQALYEVLENKGILTGVEIIKRIKELKNEVKVNLGRPN